MNSKLLVKCFKKGNILWYFLFFFILFSSCGEQAEKSSEKETAGKEQEMKPPAASELALLMRNMHLQVAEFKEAILRGDTFPHDLVTDFTRIHNAIPTDSTVKGPVYEGLANDFIKKLELTADNDSGQVKHFNIMVNSCIDCHTVFCPGPIKTIKKLNIKE